MDTRTLLDNVATTTNNDAIIVNAKEFLKELRQVATAVAKTSDHRPNLTFVHVIIGKDYIKLEATNSHVLDTTMVAASPSPELIGKEFLIDGRFAKNISTAPSKHKESLAIYPVFNDDKYSGVASYVVDGETFIDDSKNNISVFGYPDLDQLEPYWNQATIMFNTTKKEILPLLRELKKETNSAESYAVTLYLQDQSLSIACGDKKLFVPSEDLQILTDENNAGHGLKDYYPDYEIKDGKLITFNVDYLIRAIKNTKAGEKLLFRLWKELRPLTVSRENGGYSLICPIRSFN